MAETPDPDMIEQSDNYYHVRYNDPDQFDTIRTPDWAANAAESVSEGSEVRTGQTAGSDDWLVESVLIPTEGMDEDSAKEQAQQIVEKLES
ncbi:hypothetical protein [Halocatena pleomorpha]|uniref:Uncharacterized protein n=1 Tax=Halocatena pleomorpha TaxID=1785090 RepID=A0A3P3RMZ9_9EURY|nr:hypothetical protein [Halocatena pleomorpha]RRJ33773.1 hypothetical protein EIK79_03015 [Halocatena pleomorpha]